MKSFSKSTVLGLTFGILLAFGVAVSAFQSPQLAPPGGNVPAPLNVGPADQTKTGGLLQVFGLWVSQSLGVTGGASFGGNLNLQGNKVINVGLPSLTGDVATKGFVDDQTSSLQKRVSGSCPGGQGIRAVALDGSVTCEPSKKPPTKTCGGHSGNSITYVSGGFNFVTQAAISGACTTYCGLFQPSWSCGETASSYPKPSPWFDFRTCSVIGKSFDIAAACVVQDLSCDDEAGTCTSGINWARCSCN